MSEAIEAVVALLQTAGKPLPLAKVRPVIAEALGRKRLADSILQPVLDEAQRLGRFKVERRGRTTKVILLTQDNDDGDSLESVLARLPKPARDYYQKAIDGPPQKPLCYNGRAQYSNQLQNYADYFRLRKARGLKASHPLLWVWGYNDPDAVPTHDKAYAREVLER